jgi:hypothetical protein
MTTPLNLNSAVAGLRTTSGVRSAFRFANYLKPLA